MLRTACLVTVLLCVSLLTVTVAVAAKPVDVQTTEDAKAHWLAVSGTGNATCEAPDDLCVTVSGWGYACPTEWTRRHDDDRGPDSVGRPVACAELGVVDARVHDDADTPERCVRWQRLCADVVAVSLFGDADGLVAVSGNGTAGSHGRRCAGPMVSDASYEVCSDHGPLVAASLLGDARGHLAAAGTGDAMARGCARYSEPHGFSGGYYLTSCDTGTAVSGTGNATGAVAVSATGDADGWPAISGTNPCRGARCVAVEPEGDAHAHAVAVSGTGDAESNIVALSALGNATTAGPLAVSGTGDAEGAEAVSGTGDGKGGFVAVSGTGSAGTCYYSGTYCPVVAVSGTGDSEADALAISGTGDASGGGIAVSAADALGLLP